MCFCMHEQNNRHMGYGCRQCVGFWPLIYMNTHSNTNNPQKMTQFRWHDKQSMRPYFTSASVFGNGYQKLLITDPVLKYYANELDLRGREKNGRRLVDGMRLIKVPGNISIYPEYYGFGHFHFLLEFFPHLFISTVFTNPCNYTVNLAFAMNNIILLQSISLCNKIMKML